MQFGEQDRRVGERLTHAELWQGLSNPPRPALFETHIKLGREREKRGLYLREAEKQADWEKGSESGGVLGVGEGAPCI